MNLYLRHFMEGPDATLGMLYVDGDFECFTLELPWKDNQVNVSRIPDGVYKVELEYSSHFGRKLPELRNVPERSEIKFHPANFPIELKGCIAVGQTVGKDFIRSSGLALDRLMDKLLAVSVGEEMWVNIT